MSEETEVVEVPLVATQPAEPTKLGTKTEAEVKAALWEGLGPDPDAPATKEETPPAQPEGQPEVDEKAKAAKEEKEPDAEMATAFKTLLDSGVPTEALKNASKATILKWAAKQATREADIQRAFQERSDLKKKLDERPEATKGAEPVAVPTATPQDLGAFIKPFAEESGLSEEVLTKFAEGLLQAVEVRYGGEVRSLASNASAAQELQLERGRERLTERFGGLADDTKFAKVIEKMRMLGATGAYSELPTVRERVDACMGDACRLVFDDAGADVARQRRAEVGRDKNNGQPIVSSRRAPAKSKTIEERQRAAFEVMEDGGTDDEMKVAMRG